MKLEKYTEPGSFHHLHIQLGITTNRMVELDTIMDNMILDMANDDPGKIEMATYLVQLAKASRDNQEFAYLCTTFTSWLTYNGFTKDLRGHSYFPNVNK
jgi:hypothetical protein